MKFYYIPLLLAVLSLSCSCSNDDDGEVPAEQLQLNVTELILDVGEEATLEVTQTPQNGETIEWDVDDESVATVFLGKVTALSSGTATVIATMGEYTATCIVTVPERNYELVWSDEFEGSNLNMDNWTYEIGTGSWGWGNNEAQYYTDRPENIRLEDGYLIIEARKEDYQGSQYTSARIKTADKQEFTYGKIEARLQVPSGMGTWPALWMLGIDGDWPECGEIDIMEHVGKDPNAFHCALHTKNKNGMNGRNFKASQFFVEPVANNFYVIKLEWVKDEVLGYDRMHFYVDDVKTATFGETTQLQDSGDWPFNQPFFLILNLAIGGNWGGEIDDAVFNEPVLYKLDYIRVYQFK